MYGAIFVSSIAILLVLILRSVFEKIISRRFLYALWLIPAICLLVFPFLPIEFEFWIWITQRIFHLYRIAVAGILQCLGFSFPALAAPSAEEYMKITKLLFILDLNYGRYGWIKWVWRAGMLLVLLFQTITAVRCYLDFKNAAHRISGNGLTRLKVFETEKINSPVLIGASIFLPCGTKENAMLYRYSLLHEEMHFKQGDFFWNILRILLVSIYWLHPLVWLAVLVSKKDSEFSCDEGVVEHITFDERLEYGKVILETATGLKFENRGKLSESYLTGADTKKRIKRIAKPQRKTWYKGMIMAAIAGVFVTGAAMLVHTENQWERRIVIEEMEQSFVRLIIYPSP